MSQHSLPNRLWYNFLRMIVQITGVLVFQVRHTGQKNIPSQGGVLVVPNHQSHLDPPLVGMGCRRHMNYLARESLFVFAPFAWLIRSINAIPIDREGFGIAGIKESLRHLKRGEMVLIFPEGTRTPDGEIKQFRPGFTSLAVRSHAAILPVAIAGAFQCWPKSRTFPRPGKIRVHYGQPVLPQEYEGLNEQELISLVEKRVRQCHALVLRQLGKSSPS
ncbi:MAG: lysophospholipid acyltransferase family protein [Thermoguttaceae bacterium]|jgi:1-acyl-sn-glycerol-3-phosphate acyltransferase